MPIDVIPHALHGVDSLGADLQPRDRMVALAVAFASVETVLEQGAVVGGVAIVLDGMDQPLEHQREGIDPVHQVEAQFCMLLGFDHLVDDAQAPFKVTGEKRTGENPRAAF